MLSLSHTFPILAPDRVPTLIRLESGREMKFNNVIIFDTRSQSVLVPILPFPSRPHPDYADCIPTKMKF